MLEQKIRVVSEALARGVDRRNFLKKAGGAVVTGVVAVAMGSRLGREVPKAEASPLVPTVANCSPPGPYCNLDGQNEPNGCRGASCFQHFSGGQVQQCNVYYAFYPTTGCWTTQSGNGYWTCCDCTCSGGSSCGCAQYTSGSGVYPD